MLLFIPFLLTEAENDTRQTAIVARFIYACLPPPPHHTIMVKTYYATVALVGEEVVDSEHLPLVRNIRNGHEHLIFGFGEFEKSTF